MRSKKFSRFLFLLALLSLFHASPALSQERKVNIAYAGPTLISLPFLAAQEWKLFSQNGVSAQLIVMTFTVSIPAFFSEQVDYLGGVGPATVSSALRQEIPLLERCVEGAFPLPSRERARVRGRCKPRSPSPHSSPIKGEEVRNLTVGEKRTNVLVLPAASSDASRHCCQGQKNLGSEVQSRPQEVKAVIKSVQQAKQRMFKSKEETIGLVMKVTKTDREAALKTYDMLQEVIGGNGIPTRAGIENILKALVLQGRLPSANVPFEEIADTRIATEVAKELGYRIE